MGPLVQHGLDFKKDPQRTSTALGIGTEEMRRRRRRRRLQVLRIESRNAACSVVDSAPNMSREQAEAQISLCLGDATSSLSVLDARAQGRGAEHAPALRNRTGQAAGQGARAKYQSVGELEAERDDATRVARLVRSPQHWDDAPRRNQAPPTSCALRSCGRKSTSPDNDLLGPDAWSKTSTLPDELRDDKDVFLAWRQRKAARDLLAGWAFSASVGSTTA